MTTVEDEFPEYAWPSGPGWNWHDHPHDTFSCPRCLREADWHEAHMDCDCLAYEWERRDLGTPAVPRLVWCCSECLRVQGPAYSGSLMGEVPF